VIDGKIVDEQVLRARFEQLHKDSPRRRSSSKRTPACSRQGRRGDGSGQSESESTALPSPPTPAGSSAAKLLESAAIPRRFRDALLERTIVPVNPPVLESVPFAT